MTNLQELERKYEELGEEIKRLKTFPKLEKVTLPKLPSSLKVHVASDRMTWQDAMDYASKLGMRLPTKFELQAIAEDTQFNSLGWTWSSSTYSDITSYAWNVYLTNGYTNYDSKTFPKSVLCVAQ